MADMRTIGVKLRLDYGEYTRDADKAAGATGRIGTNLEGISVKGTQSLQNISSKMAFVGAGIAAFAGIAIKSNMEFEKQISEVGAVSGATGDQLDKLRVAAIKAGQATVFSASEAAQAEAELAKAGVSTADILGGALSGSLSLAAAGQIDLGNAAAIAAAAMNTFGLKGDQVGHIADVLASGANKSAAGVEDLGQGLQQVGLVANQAGLSLEETVGTLSAFADRGLRGSDGATSLKTALERLIAPTDAAKSTLDELGISAYDNNGQLVSITNVAGQLQSKLKDLAPAQRNAALQTIFGSDAIRAANIFYNLGTQGLQDYITAVNQSGAAQDVAAKKMDNLAGDVENLKGSLETLTIQSGGGVNTGLRVLAKGFTGLINEIGQLPPAVLTGVTAVVGLTGVGLLGAAAMLKLRASVAATTEALARMGVVGSAAGKTLGFLAGFSGKLILAAGAVELLDTAVNAISTRSAAADVDTLTKSLTNLAAASGKSQQKLETADVSLQHIDHDLSTLARGGLASVEYGVASVAESIPILGTLGANLDSDSLKHASERIQALDQSLAQMINSGHGDEAVKVFEQLVAKAEESGVSLEELTKGFPEYTKAYGDFQTKTGAGFGQLDAAYAKLNETTDQYGHTTAQVKSANEQLAASFHAVAHAEDDATYASYALKGANLDLRAAQRKLAQDTDDLKAALKESGKKFDDNTEAGRRANAMIDQFAKDAADAAQATYNQTGSMDAANVAYEKVIANLRKILTDAGLSATKVDELIKSIVNMPAMKTVGIQVKVYGAGAAAQLGLEVAGGRTSHQEFAKGGISRPVYASQGLTSAAVYRPTSPALYGFAEPETGGEAFIPRNGDRGRGLGILSAAASWYDADIVPHGWYGGGGPAGGGGGMAGPLTVENHIEVGGEVVRVVKTQIDAGNRATRRRVMAGASR